MTGSWVGDHSLQEWDWTSGKVKREVQFDYKGHDGAYLYCSQYCDNDTVLAGGSGTNSVQAINMATGQVRVISVQATNMATGRVSVVGVQAINMATGECDKCTGNKPGNRPSESD